MLTSTPFPLEVLESRTLLAQVEGSFSDPDQLEPHEMSWEHMAVIGGGMLAYGGFFFIAAEGGELAFTKKSAIFGAFGLWLGYSVGVGAITDWMDYGQDVVEI